MLGLKVITSQLRECGWRFEFMSNHRLTFLALSVSDLVQSARFYRDILGVPLELSSHDAELNDVWYGGDHAALSWTVGAFIHFAIYPYCLPERPVTRATQLGSHVDDIGIIHSKMDDAGVAIIEPPRDEPWGKTVRYLDPDGNIVSITQR